MRVQATLLDRDVAVSFGRGDAYASQPPERCHPVEWWKVLCFPEKGDDFPAWEELLEAAEEAVDNADTQIDHGKHTVEAWQFGEKFPGPGNCVRLEIRREAD